MEESRTKRLLLVAGGFITVYCFLQWLPFLDNSEIGLKPIAKHYPDENNIRNKNEVPIAASSKLGEPEFPEYRKYSENSYPEPWRVLDIKIQYIINNDICEQEENKDEISIINLIHTHAAHFEMRQIIRDSFTQEDLKSVGMRRVFLLANPDRTQFHQGNLSQINSKIKTSTSNETLVDFWSKVTAENSRHSDLVMGDFIEDYRNMTYKHLMGLDWASKFCPQAGFIIKQDDDTAVDFYQVKNLLDFATAKSHENSSTTLASSISPEKMELALQLREKLSTSSESKSIDAGKKEKDDRFFMGKNEINLAPERANTKWTVTKTEFADKFYPNFIYGWFYVTTIKSARGIVQASLHPSARFFWIDDVFVTGVLRESAGIEIVSAVNFGSHYSDHLLPCLNPTNGVVKKEEISGQKDRSSWTIPHKKGVWCHQLAVLLTPNKLGYLKTLHKEAKWCYFTHLCGPK